MLYYKMIDKEYDVNVNSAWVKNTKVFDTELWSGVSAKQEARQEASVTREATIEPQLESKQTSPNMQDIVKSEEFQSALDGITGVTTSSHETDSKAPTAHSDPDRSQQDVGTSR